MMEYVLTWGDLELYVIQIEKSGAYAKASATACRGHSSQQDLSRKDSEFSRVDEVLNVYLPEIELGEHSSAHYEIRE